MEILKYFEDEIDSLAKEEANQILLSMNKKVDDTIKNFEDELENKKALLIKQKKMEMLSESKKELSIIDFKTNNQLDNKRKLIEDEVFQEAENKILEFQKTDKYKENMKQNIEEICKDFENKESELLVCKNDVELFKSFVPSYIEVKENREFKLGGFIYKNDQFEINHSYDELLQQQKDWFYLNSGLYIR